jgi:hypothetical protein
MLTLQTREEVGKNTPLNELHDKIPDCAIKYLIALHQPRQAGSTWDSLFPNQKGCADSVNCDGKHWGF